MEYIVRDEYIHLGNGSISRPLVPNQRTFKGANVHPKG